MLSLAVGSSEHLLPGETAAFWPAVTGWRVLRWKVTERELGLGCISAELLPSVSS